jgi:signal transduction histidine kinase
LLTQYLYLSGNCYKMTSQYDSALYFLKKAGLLAKRQKNFKYGARVLLEMCSIHDLRSEMDLLKTALAQLETIVPHLDANSWEMASYWLRKGHTAFFLARYDQSLASYQKALQVFQYREDSVNVALGFLYVGRVHKTQKNLPAALNYLSWANGLYTHLQLLYQTGHCHFEIAELYDQHGRQDSAKVYYQKAYRVARAYENKHLLAITLLGIGKIEQKQPGGYPKAKKTFTEALRIARTEGLKHQVKNAYFALGETEYAQGHFAVARRHYARGLDIALAVVSQEDVLSFYQQLALTEEALNHTAQALRYQKRVNRYQDSIFTEKSNRAIAEMEARYQTRQNQQRIALLKAQNTAQQLELAVQQRNQLLLALGMLATGLAGYIAYRRYQLRKKLELEQVRSRIAADFHDELGANLSSIALYSNILLADRPAEALKSRVMLENISHNARSTLSAINDLIWTINPDNDRLEQTIIRMKEYAFPLMEANHIAFDFEVANAFKELQLDMNTRKFIYLIFKEAINNALKYAQATQIQASLRQQHDRLRMRIHDNGKGFDPETARQGNGLKNMQKRASELGGTIAIDSSASSGTTVELNFKFAGNIPSLRD